MSYEAQGNQQATRLLSVQLEQARTKQAASDCRALLNGGMPSGIKINQADRRHQTVQQDEVYRPQNATGLLATDYALDDYNTWK